MARRAGGAVRQVAVVARYELTFLTRERLIFVLLFVIPAALIFVVGRGYQAGGVALTDTVPGITVLFAFSVTSYIGSAFFREVWWRSWPRTLSLPCPRIALITGKVAPVFCIGCLQVAVLIVGAHLTLGVPIAGPPLLLAPLVVVTVAVACCLGALLAAVCGSWPQVMQATYLFVVLGGALGGGVAPVRNLPGWLGAISHVTPQYWAIDGIRAVLEDRATPGRMAVDLGVLCGMVVAVAAATRWRFDLNRISDR